MLSESNKKWLLNEIISLQFYCIRYMKNVTKNIIIIIRNLLSVEVNIFIRHPIFLMDIQKNKIKIKIQPEREDEII